MIHAQCQGVEFDLDEAALSDFRTLGLFSRMQAKDPTALWEYAVKVFGQEQLETILDQLPKTDVMSVINFMNGAVVAAAAAKGENPKN